MLVIRKEQMAVLSKSMEDRFVQKMVDHLCTDFAPQITALGLSEERLRLAICQHIATARQHDVRMQGDLTTYVECIALLGPQFDTNGRHEFVRQILHRDALDGSEKMDLVREYLVFAVDDTAMPAVGNTASFQVGQTVSDAA
jgi:hypothetical protein